MAAGEANFFTSLRPIYLWNKLFGLVPFSVRGPSDGRQCLSVSCWDIFYSCLIAAFACVVSVCKLWKTSLTQVDYTLISSEYINVTLILLTILITIVKGYCSAPLFETLIQKITKSEIFLYTSTNLDKISQRNRQHVIYIIVINFSLELFFCCWYLLRHVSHTFLDNFAFLFALNDIINSAILSQLLTWFWFFIQRFTRINTQLNESTQSLLLKKGTKVVVSDCSPGNNDNR